MTFSPRRRLEVSANYFTLERDGVDGKSIYVYGEGWDFGEVAGNARFVQARQLATFGKVGTGVDRPAFSPPDVAARRSTPPRSGPRRSTRRSSASATTSCSCA